MKKITVFVPARLLGSAQSFTEAGISETVRQGLEMLTHRKASEGLLALRGKVAFADFDLHELREDREFDQHGDVLP